MKIHLLFIFALCFLVLSENQARNYYVSPTEDDISNSGTITNPFALVMRAQQAVEAGDTVYFRCRLWFRVRNRNYDNNG